jgi:hypothetical protein
MTRHSWQEDCHGSFLSFDLGLAAALVTAGHTLAAIDKSNRSKAQFAFVQKHSLEKDVELYWSDELVLPARSLFDNLKMLKNRLYSD